MRKCSMCKQEKSDEKFDPVQIPKHHRPSKVLDLLKSAITCRDCLDKKFGQITLMKRFKHLFGIHTFEPTPLGFNFCFVCRTREPAVDDQPILEEKPRSYFKPRDCRNYKNKEE